LLRLVCQCPIGFFDAVVPRVGKRTVQRSPDGTLLGADAPGIVRADATVRLGRSLLRLLESETDGGRFAKLWIVEVLAGAIQERVVQVLMRIAAFLQQWHRELCHLLAQRLLKPKIFCAGGTASGAGVQLTHGVLPLAQ